MRKSRALLMCAVLVAPLVFSAWSSSSARISSQATIARLRLHARGIDAEFLDVEMQVPGFAGVYIDSVTRSPVVMLTDQSRRRRAKIEMPRILARRRHGHQTLAFRQASFTFADLYGWQEEISTALIRDNSITSIGIDHRGNRIAVGVRAGRSLLSLRAVLTRLRIPNEAVDFELAARVTTLSDLASTAFSPHVSGERTVWDTTGGYHICSMGPIVKWNNGTYIGFLTNGHCTKSYWGNGQPATLYWNAPGTMTQIGEEVANPSPVTCPSEVSTADSLAVCRYSEAALIKTYSGQSPNFGYITHTTGSYSTIVGGSMTVADSAGTPMQGEYIAYTGATGGFHAGLVYQPSVNVRMDTIVHRWVVASVRVEGDTAHHGDSGGPAWSIADDTYCNATACYGWPSAVHIAGMLWGTIQGTSHDGWLYSPMSSIVSEIGALEIRSATTGDGGPLVASSLLAPYPVYASETHGYSLFATGGTLPFTCDWSIDYSVVETGASCTDWEYQNGGSDFNVSVVLHDAASHSTSGAVNVYIYSCNPPEDECVMEDYNNPPSSVSHPSASLWLRRLMGIAEPSRNRLQRAELRDIFYAAPRIWLLQGGER